MRSTGLGGRVAPVQSDLAAMAVTLLSGTERPSLDPD